MLSIFSTRQQSSTRRRTVMENVRGRGVQLFNNQHELNGGSLDEYDSTVTDSGDLSVVAPGLRGTGFKMQCLIDGTGAIYGEKLISPPSSGVLRVRVYIDPNSLTIGDADNFIFFAVRNAANDLLEIRLGIDTGVYELFTLTADDALGSHIGVFISITDEPHYVEVEMRKATTSGSADGVTTMWIDGVKVDEETGIDNFDIFEEMINVRLGAIGSVDVGTSGSLFLDELVVRDDNQQIGA